MKICFKCNQYKLLSEFYRHAQMADGYLNKCKACTRSDVLDRSSTPGGKKRQAERGRRYYLKNKSLCVNRAKKWKAKNRERNNRSSREWIKRNMEKRLAHNAVWAARRSGRLHKLPCEICGNDRSQAHHDDYSKPLDVMWLCPQHHADRHRFLAELISRGAG